MILKEIFKDDLEINNTKIIIKKFNFIIDLKDKNKDLFDKKNDNLNINKDLFDKKNDNLNINKDNLKINKDNLNIKNDNLNIKNDNLNINKDNLNIKNDNLNINKSGDNQFNENISFDNKNSIEKILSNHQTTFYIYSSLVDFIKKDEIPTSREFFMSEADFLLWKSRRNIKIKEKKMTGKEYFLQNKFCEEN
ncbi:hypothetical protein DMUE_1719 [Dictyocoela muelleri]|nr:hypothetical protein DMUE_1719 [Dictyocoela muelleri]